MDHLPIDKQHAILLLIATLWTTFFSMSQKRWVRGYRNLGILASYILSIVMLIRLPFVTALTTWCAFGVVAAVIYNFYDLVVYARNKSTDKKLEQSLAYFIYSPLAWPIMIPETIEYLLAEVGVLKVPPVTPPLEAGLPPEAPPAVSLSSGRVPLLTLQRHA